MANEKRLIEYVVKEEVCKLCDNKKEYCGKEKCPVYKAPTVDAVEVVHGRWETANDGTHFCSRCGCDAPYTWDDIDRSFINSADDVPDRPSNYCPNCGAKDGW